MVRWLSGGRPAKVRWSFGGGSGGGTVAGHRMTMLVTAFNRIVDWLVGGGWFGDGSDDSWYKTHTWHALIGGSSWRTMNTISYQSLAIKSVGGKFLEAALYTLLTRMSELPLELAI
ncbi:hypothetical protein Tco_1141913 [Tanacetum coccineum]